MHPSTRRARERMAKFSPEEHEMEIWLDSCAVAHWCGILSERRVRLLDNTFGGWRIEIPEDLVDLDCMWFASTYLALVNFYDIWGTRNPRTQLVFNLFFHLTTHGLIVQDL